MTTVNETSAKLPGEFILPASQDRFGTVRDIGISTITFKVAHVDSTELFIAENLMRSKGGPPRHVHHTQDEWFFVRQGEFIIEVGQERRVLRPGDSVWGPRGVPHVWAYTSEGPGSILFVFNPAAKIEPFFEALANLHSPAPSEPKFWRPYEMDWIGAPLTV